MAVEPPTPTPAAGIAQGISVFVSTSILAAIGCIAIAAATPFLKSEILNRRLNTVRLHANSGHASHAITMLHQLQPMLQPYRDHALEAQKMLARLQAALRQYDAAATAARQASMIINQAPVTTADRTALPLTQIPEAWSHQFYNRITANRLPADPWTGYRELAQYYQSIRSEDGIRHLRDHLDQQYPDGHFLNPIAGQPPNSPLPAGPTPRTPAAHAQPSGHSSDENSDHSQTLQTRRQQLLDRIAAAEQGRTPTPRMDPAATAPAPSVNDARRQLEEYQQRVTRLRREMEQAVGSRRTEIINELQNMRYEGFRLQQAAAGVVESIAPRVSDHNPAPGTANLQNLRRELADIERQLQQRTQTP